MLNKILVAIDSSETGESIFQEALELAQATHASLMILHVITVEEEGYPDPIFVPSVPYAPGLSDVALDTYRQKLDQLQAEGLERLQLLTRKAKLLNVLADYTQVAGNPGSVICDLAQSWEADLILMGSRRRTGLSELLLGSVSNYVVHHAPCSVFVQRSPAQNESLPEFTPRTHQSQPEAHLAGWQ